MYQRWRELLFLHWTAEPAEIQARIPPGLHVDCYNGQAWIGLVPFRMEGVRPRFLPALPGLSAFPELNLRTYVYDNRGRPGVWFFSLDTPRAFANWIARTFFHLNYQLAEMESRTSGPGRIHYTCRRRGTNNPQHFEWERTGLHRRATEGSLEFFLVERYRLFAYDWKKKRLHTGKVHHAPYPLQIARVDALSEELFAINQLPMPKNSPESVIASPGVNVQIHPLVRID